ncbi:MAG: hypothetical protein QOG31_509 [Thermoplasmata archaeon]|nr:hypothetical protein [Thermoplasmata archaeon]
MALAIATAVALLWFMQVAERRLTPQDYAHIRPRLYTTLAGDLLAPVVAWFAIKAINRRRRIVA